MHGVSPAAVVGRVRERETIAAALASLPGRTAGIVVAVEGEPGIGKTRLLAHVAECAAADGATVLGARASEFEADLPYALWTEALDRHLSDAGERRVSLLGLTDAAGLETVLPALVDGATEPVPSDRHRTHRALRDLLERLAAPRPLVVWMDDVQWADPASLEALAALVRRPPAAPVLFAIAAREGQVPAALALALAGAHREDRMSELRLAPLSEAEATELVGDRAVAIYAQAGGNPFYLEQLARVSRTAPLRPAALDGSVPPAVAAALGAELAALAPETRRVLDAAAVVGDPFEPELVAAVAELPEPVALQALDELLLCALIRPGAAPRRFVFRHAIVRHAVYAATPRAWRLGAHARTAEALERRGAGPVARAHHVEHAARPGDEAAIDLLGTAAAALQSPAPGAAARFYAAALRLLPDRPEYQQRRIGMQRSLADAQAAAGDAAAARETLLDALHIAGAHQRLGLTVAIANQDWWIGGHEDARRRLQIALTELPAQPSPDRVRLRLALGLTALIAGELPDAQAHASDACDDARAIADPAVELAALALGALASASAAAGPAARRRLDESAAAMERLTSQQLATRLPAFWMHGRARRALGQFEAALADLRRGAALAEQTGRERILLIVTVESVAVLVELGRLVEATAVAEDGVERARLSRNPRMLLWAQSALSSARLAAGDITGALRDAEQAAEPETRADFRAAGQPGWCLGAALTAAGNAQRAVPLLLDAFGGRDLTRVLPADRAAAAGDLIDAHLALGDVAAAQAALARLQAGAQPRATAALVVTGLARAAVLLAQAQPHAAADAAAAARVTAAGAPLLAARAALAHGKALAAAGERRAAVQALANAEATLGGFGAARWRDEAVRELRRLGHRVLRPARTADGDPLTAREREIAELVVVGRTNREIAEQLVLSIRTIETHLRNIYAKLGARSRVELTRALLHAHDADGD